MPKITFFIDGFNVYHALDENPHLHRFKWIDYKKLCAAFLTKADELEDVYYFTSYAHWKPAAVARHQIFVRAQEWQGVEVVLGEFKMRDRKCGGKCGKWYKAPEEKQTDINIALKMFQSAINDEFDVGILVTGDSDHVATIKAFKESFPAKQIGVIIPIGRRSEDLKNVAHFYRRMKLHHLVSSKFPDEVVKDGAKLIRPPNWVSPTSQVKTAQNGPPVKST